jgi:hypothetical protein
MRRILVLLIAGILAAGCSGGEATSAAFPEGALAVSASSDVAVGNNRLLVGVSLPDGSRLGSPQEPVSVEIAPLEDPSDVRAFAAEFVWIIEDVIGIYRANVEVDAPGAWSLTVVPDDGAAVTPTVFQVRAEPLTPAVGTPAIVVPTPTLADAAIGDLTTDPDPDPSFYDTSLDDALRSGSPTVVVFATPAFCQTAACGPMLDTVKRVAGGRPDVSFVHVEIYHGFGDEGFAPDAAHLAPAVQAWGLPSEPWVFVTDAAGTISAKFEGVLDAAELEEALDGV